MTYGLVMLSLLLAGNTDAQPRRKPIPVYEELAPLAKRIEPVDGCHVYTGSVHELLRLPIVGRVEGDFTFTGHLDEGVWREMKWAADSTRNGSGVITADFYDEGDLHPATDPLFGSMPKPMDLARFKSDVDLASLAAQTPAAQAPASTTAPLAKALTFPLSPEGPAKGDVDLRSKASAPIITPESEATAPPLAPRPPGLAPEQPPEVTAAPSQQLSWAQKLAMKAAIKKLMAEAEPDLNAAGVDAEAVEAAVFGLIEGSEEGDLDLSRVDLSHIAGGASPEVQSLLTTVQGLMAAADSEGSSLVSAAREGDESALLNALEAMDSEGDEAARPVELSEADRQRTVTLTVVDAAPDGATPIPSEPEGKGFGSDITAILDYMDAQVEMMHVLADRQGGRQVYVLERLVDMDTTWTGRQRRSGQFVTFDGESMRPIRWEVRVDHPIRLRKKADAPGKVRSFHAVVEVDQAGQAIFETYALDYNLGPLRIELERETIYDYDGPCPPTQSDQGSSD